MATLEQLPADRRAIIELVLRRGQTYSDLANALDMPEARVRRYAREALASLSPEDAERVESEWLGQIADYLLRQQEGPQAKATRAHIKRSEPAQAWALTMLDSLADLYPAGATPDVPGDGVSEAAVRESGTADGDGEGGEASVRERGHREPGRSAEQRRERRAGGDAARERRRDPEAARRRRADREAARQRRAERDVTRERRQSAAARAAATTAPGTAAKTAAKPSRTSRLASDASAIVRRRRIIGGAAAALIAAGAIVGILFLTGVFGGDEEAAAGDAQTDPLGQQPPELLGQIRLEPVGGANGAGTAAIGTQQDQPFVVVQARVEPTGRSEAYVVWLYNSRQDAVPVGAIQTDRQGNLQGAGPLPPDFEQYESIDISLQERQGSAEHSGNSVLRGPVAELQPPPE